ncbi:MAG TPA: PEP-CTERM sorting domain-containing protein [Verrucomicrobiae bacterium]|nr:PEP-CTERM sorting domain-containing protein [Verrucomicrobiae bacterium]
MLRVLGVARPVVAGWRGWVSAVITSLLLSGGFVSSGFAQITNLSLGDSIQLSQLTNGLSLQVGDKLFSDFIFGYTDTDANAGNDLQSSMVLVSSLSNQIGFGLEFQLPLEAVSNETKDVKLEFSVQVLNSANLISDAHLSFVSSAIGLARADVSENIYTNGFGGDSIATLNVGNPGNSADFSPSAAFPVPQAKIWVEKDIITHAYGSGGDDSAHISIVDQTFSQVPEPSTLVLLVAGLIGLLLVTRRTKRAQTVDIRRRRR